MKMKIISEAKSVGCYSSIGSEVQTSDIINYLLDDGKSVSLPKVSQDEMTFRKVDDISKLEKGEFDIAHLQIIHLTFYHQLRTLNNLKNVY